MRASIPYNPRKHDGMLNPYTGETISGPSSYDEYLREYVYHRLCDSLASDYYERRFEECRQELSAKHRAEIQRITACHQAELKRRARRFTGWLLSLALVVVIALAWYVPMRTDRAYTDGENAGITSGYNKGYNAGYDEGENDGYQDGYSAGVRNRPTHSSSSGGSPTFIVPNGNSGGGSGGGGTVYITDTGSKYHRNGCQYLRSSKIPISRADAIAEGYGPCSRCDP